MMYGCLSSIPGRRLSASTNQSTNSSKRPRRHSSNYSTDPGGTRRRSSNNSTDRRSSNKSTDRHSSTYSTEEGGRKYSGSGRRYSSQGDWDEFTDKKSSDTEMNKPMFLLVFLSGVFLAMFLGGLFGEYFKACLKLKLPVSSYLADSSYLEILEDTNLVSLRLTQIGQVRKQTEHEVADADRSSLSEALNSVSAEQEMRKLAKLDKALRLYQHALALAPHNPEVLNSYGEFLEDSRKDVVEADHLYALAVAFSDTHTPHHARALANRKRTAVRVEEIDKVVLRNIDKKKLQFLEIGEKSAALKRAKKEAYFQYVYHTVGIEGNTMSLAQTRSILETKLAVAGKSIMEHNEILGMDAALKFINQTLVDKMGDITLQDILEIHKRVIGNVDPLEAGIFRTTQVYVGDHVPPPPSLVELLSSRFIAWLNSYPALSLHPVRLSALAHYKLVYIHPFIDGNGRTSRLLMNLVLMQAGFPPVIIRRADRELYYRYLQLANLGDIRPFVRFIAHCTEKTLDAYIWAAREYNDADKIEPGVGGVGDLPPNLIEHGVDQIHNIRAQSGYRNQPPRDSFLDFSSSQDRIIPGYQDQDQDQVQDQVQDRIIPVFLDQDQDQVKDQDNIIRTEHVL